MKYNYSKISAFELKSTVWIDFQKEKMEKKDWQNNIKVFPIWQDRRTCNGHQQMHDSLSLTDTIEIYTCTLCNYHLLLRGLTSGTPRKIDIYDKKSYSCKVPGREHRINAKKPSPRRSANSNNKYLLYTSNIRKQFLI